MNALLTPWALFMTAEPAHLIWLTLLLPLAATGGNLAFKQMPNLRDGMTFVFAVLLFIVVMAIVTRFQAGTSFAMEVVTFMPGLTIAFEIEELGLVFACVASFLWILTHIYGIGYMRGNNEKKHARFFACFGFAIFATMGIAFSANLLTLFLFYELLTVSTYPLVGHKENEAARRGARTYLGILMGTSILFLLPAIIWTYAQTGTMDFVPGGVFGDTEISPLFLGIMLGLYAFGIGKAALMPFHGWLPAAMVAPTPVSALLHAVAVVKAGVFSMLKIGVFIFGIDTLNMTGA
ncbi:MAG: proton-conducting transporter membrane subunit, partial [Pseudomonadota bacterium]